MPFGYFLQHWWHHWTQSFSVGFSMFVYQIVRCAFQWSQSNNDSNDCKACTETTAIMTSTKDVMFLVRCVCLSVCQHVSLLAWASEEPTTYKQNHEADIPRSSAIRFYFQDGSFCLAGINAIHVKIQSALVKFNSDKTVNCRNIMSPYHNPLSRVSVILWDSLHVVV